MKRRIVLFLGVLLLLSLLPVQVLAAQTSDSYLDAMRRDGVGEISLEELEPNDSLAQSHYLVDDAWVSGIVHGEEFGFNEDYFSFRVNKRSEVRIAGFCDDQTTSIMLLDSSGKYLEKVNADMMREEEYVNTYYIRRVLDAGVYHFRVKNDVYPFLPVTLLPWM